MNAITDIEVPADALRQPRNPSMDAMLLRLERDLLKAWAVENEAFATEGDLSDEEADAAGDAAGHIALRIARVQAYTLDGILAKMRALAYCRCGEPRDVEASEFGIESGEPPTDVRLMVSVLQDLAAMVGRVPA